jgi:hypothetical protein
VTDTDTDVGLLNPHTADAANYRVRSIRHSACNSRSATPMLSVGGGGADTRRLSFAEEEMLRSSGNRSTSRRRPCASYHENYLQTQVGSGQNR